MSNTAETKSKSKKWVVVLIIAVVLVAIGILFFSGRPTSAAVSPQSSDAAKGEISTKVVGTGNLEPQEAENLKGYNSLEYTEIYVESGDLLRQGDIIAEVDKESVNNRIRELEAEIDSSNMSLYAMDKGYTDKYLSPATEGRIKEIYGKEGDSAKDIMLEHGALALISADGKMALSINSEELKTDGYAEVVLTDGTVREGKVQDVNKGSATVTFGDYQVADGDTVKVQKSDGTVLGEGEAYIYEPVKVILSEGTIDEIYFEKDDYIYSGSSLFYIAEIPSSNDYATLESDIAELEKELNYMLKISETNQIIAEAEGEVAAVNITEKGASGNDSAAVTTAASADMQMQGSASGEETSADAGESQSVSSNGPEITLLSYYPDDKMRLFISVDELDILQVEAGQAVSVMFDAIEDKEFSGAILQVDSKGTVNNGSAKYQAEIELEKTEDMRAGMNATATVTTSEKGNALLIPVSALQEQGDKIYVYTSWNSETGELGDTAEVVTGLSDGEQVEIIEGISEGDTVYYFASTGQENAFAQMGGGMGFGGGSREQSAG